MNTIGGIATAVLGISWGLYMLASAGVVGATLAVERVRTKGQGDA